MRSLKKMTVHTLKALRDQLRREALHVGQWPEHATEHVKKSKAFRCIAYNTAVRQISALDDVLAYIEDKGDLGGWRVVRMKRQYATPGENAKLIPVLLAEVEKLGKRKRKGRGKG